jgi:hypothetical protein
MDQNTNTKKLEEGDTITWSASDESQHTLFSGKSEEEEIPRTAMSDELAGINHEAMQEVMREAHRGLFGGTADVVEEDSPVVIEEAAGIRDVPAEDITDADKEIMFSISADVAAAAPKMANDEVVSLPKSKFELIEKLLSNISENTQRVAELLSGGVSEDEVRARIGRVLAGDSQNSEDDTGGGNIIEGVFNGQCMIGPDGKQYNMPSNYASKSKLVEGDILKLTITPSGKFIYKQIGPIERTRVVGTLVVGVNGEHYVEKDGTKWKILTASVTYFKGRHSDEAIILVPKHGESTWAAVENIVSSGL